jgi:hypothetical protein
MTKSLLSLLLGKTDGEGMKTIVNVTSARALSLPPGASAHQTTKFAILKFAELVMLEYDRRFPLLSSASNRCD